MTTRDLLKKMSQVGTCDSNHHSARSPHASPNPMEDSHVKLTAVPTLPTEVVTILDPSLLGSEDAVIIYLRLSQDALLDHKGVERQLAGCWAWASRNERRVAAIVMDNDVSATKGKRRAGFEALLDGEFGTTPILVWHHDRLMRVTKDLERVIDCKLTVFTVEAGSVDLSNPTGKAIARTVTAWATHEGELKALRQKASHRQRVGAGKPFLGGSRPFGFEKDHANETLRLRPEEAALLRQAYTRLLAGDAGEAIARMMNASNLRTVGGKEWAFHSVRNLLVQPRNAGILAYNGVEVGPGNWQGIVSVETYRAAMALLGNSSRRTAGPRKGRGAVEHLLTGLVECSECGSPARIERRPSPGGRYRLYTCRKGCSSARSDWLEGKFSSLIVTRLTTPYNERLAGDVVDTAELREEMARLEMKGEHYAHMLDADEMSFDQFTIVNKKNRERMDEIKRQLSSIGLSTHMVALLDVKDIGRHWVETMTVQERNAVARSHIERIVISPRSKGIGKDRPAVAKYRLVGEDRLRDL